MFAHLHVRSCYSFLEGTAHPAELAQRAAGWGMPALALTDHGSLTGAVEFVEACQKEGVRPLLGLEVDVVPPGAQAPLGADFHPSYPLVLLALDASGWTSLCRISTALRTPGHHQPGPEPCLTLDQLSAESGGLLCLTGGHRSYLDTCLRSRDPAPASPWLAQLADVFPDRLYVELAPLFQGTSQVKTAQAAAQARLPLVAAAPVCFLRPEDAPLQRLVSAIRTNQALDRLPDMACAPADAWFLSPEEVQKRFQDYPQAVEAALEAASRCQVELPLHRPLFPAVSTPPGESADQVLRQRAEAGAIRLYGDLTPDLRQRLDHELAVISERGYSVLFLIVEEILGFARQRGVPLSSRGSAASSLVAHCLKITSPDPLSLNLYFERFLNPVRKTPPDIDTDLCSRRRDDVIDFVYRRFGADRVAMVGTINRFRRRSALRETAKAYGLTPRQVGDLVNQLPHVWGPPSPAAKDISPYAALEAQHPSPLYQTIFQAAARLRGLPRHLSIHPGGIVIAPQPMTEIAPTQLASKGVVITQFDLESIESLGLVKIDLLGIRGLSVLGDVGQWLAQSEALSPEAASSRDVLCRAWGLGPQPTSTELLDSIPEDDPDVADAVQGGRTIGCFQIESPGMRATLREIGASSPADIMAALALYRPGPLLGGLKDAFVRRFRGLEQPSHLHPALQPLLADTFGVILYQEQVLRIAHELAGLSLADADLLRRAMSHFDPGKEMQTLQERFVHGAVTRSGVQAAVAERVWEMMAAFAGYGFPKAHAASYAQVAWRSAWCKTHLPGVFMAAVLANWGGYYSQRVYLTEARRMGLRVLPPHVNHSEQEFCLRFLDGQPALFMGLDQVRDLTRKTQARILRSRPYHSLFDFLTRVDPRPAEAENLALSGAFTGLGSVSSLLRQIKIGRWQGGQLPLFSESGTGDGDEWSQKQQMESEEAILGLSVTFHKLDLVSEKLAAAGARTTVEAAGLVGQEVRLAGMRQTWRRVSTAHAEPVYFMALEDLEGMLDVIIPGAVYRRDQRELEGGGPYLIEGLVVRDAVSGEPSLRASRIWRVDPS
jgi:DNA polymerase III subunit alpha